jgi:hypothetical protein
MHTNIPVILKSTLPAAPKRKSGGGTQREDDIKKLRAFHLKKIPHKQNFSLQVESNIYIYTYIYVCVCVCIYTHIYIHIVKA